MTKIDLNYQQIVLQNAWSSWDKLYYHIVGWLVFMVLGAIIFTRLSGNIIDEL